MNIISPDSNLNIMLFPGVRQNHMGQSYREGRDGYGNVVYVDATDSRTFTFTDGNFENDTLHVVVTEGDMTYRAGSRPGSDSARIEKKQPIPRRYFTRDEHGISRPVG